MTVAELIAALQALPQAWPACIVTPTAAVAYEVAGCAQMVEGTYLPIDAIVARGDHIVMLPLDRPGEETRWPWPVISL